MLQITYPFNGAVLNHRLGTQNQDGITIAVKGIADLPGDVVVNGVKANRYGNQFHADVTLNAFDNPIVAIQDNQFGTIQHNITARWDKYSFKRYRFAIDDNSFFLRDLVQNKPKSIFDNLYLAILKRMNEKYNTKFSVNCFFETPEGDFNLTQMPEDWKQQFLDNADWLKLTWHAYNEFPDRPYQYASAEKIIADLDLVQGEIHRFAGEDTWAMPTIIHWGEILPSTLPKLYKRGIRVLSGYFSKSSERYDVSFGLDEPRCSFLEHNRLLVHYPSNVVFSRIACVVNTTKIEDIVPKLKREIGSPENAEVIDLLTHEQYFWPFYRNFIPDHEQRLDTAIKFLTDNGYEPAFYHQGFLGAKMD